MSNDDDSTGFFMKHRKGFWAFTILLVAVSGIWYLSREGYLPDLGFLASPPLLITYSVGGIVLLGGLAIYSYRSGSNRFIPSSPGTDVREQLSMREAKLLAEWDMFERDEPVMVGREIRANVKPVKSGDGDEEPIRVFEWVFEGRNEAETYAYQMSLDQEIDFNPEWIERLHPEDHEKLQNAVREIMNPALERKSDVENWEERLQENREEIGQVIRSRTGLEQLANDPRIEQVVTQNPSSKTNKEEQED